MRIEELDYDLPEELIAQEPVEPRDAAKLLVLSRKSGKVEEAVFRDIINYLKKGDVLVLNQTKVFPARVFAVKSTGGRVEVVFLSEKEQGVWEVILGGKSAVGTVIDFGEFGALVVEKNGGEALIKTVKTKDEILDYLYRHGKTPLPPYIKREANKKDATEYQTVFARQTGSAAAPTAGMHFTKELLIALEEKGVQIESVTLHVGLGTFAPVKTGMVEEHPIHKEHFEIEKEAAEAVNVAKKEGRRVIAVGTTVVRALESAVRSGQVEPQKAETSLYIYPGFEFKIIDGMITNFHTPRSSLLALVFAFAGTENVRKAYEVAVKNQYRFFSYGDAMLII